jgi:hypothetical protein
MALPSALVRKCRQGGVVKDESCFPTQHAFLKLRGVLETGATGTSNAASLVGNGDPDRYRNEVVILDKHRRKNLRARWPTREELVVQIYVTANGGMSTD